MQKLDADTEHVNVEETPIWHDSKDKLYEPLETFLGVLDEGCGFGELSMQPKQKDEELPER